MDADLSKSDAPKVHSLLKQFALNVDEERLEHTLPRIQQIIIKQKSKPGLAFKVLLQELDRQIDWQLAEEMENSFINN